MAKRLEDLAAYQLAVDFKILVYKLVREHPPAARDVRYCSQLFAAASSIEANLAEGWRRYLPRDMAQFVRYAMGSLEEAKKRVVDGVHRGYFTDADCRDALVLGNRCGAATMALLKALQGLAERKGKPARPPRSDTNS